MDYQEGQWRLLVMEFAEFIRTPMVDGVTLHRPHCQPISGTLCVTGHHIILSSRENSNEELWVGVYLFENMVYSLYLCKCF